MAVIPGIMKYVLLRMKEFCIPAEIQAYVSVLRLISTI